jgi:hypothetical protein
MPVAGGMLPGYSIPYQASTAALGVPHGYSAPCLPSTSVPVAMLPGAGATAQAAAADWGWFIDAQAANMGAMAQQLPLQPLGQFTNEPGGGWKSLGEAQFLRRFVVH